MLNSVIVEGIVSVVENKNSYYLCGHGFEINVFDKKDRGIQAGLVLRIVGSVETISGDIQVINAEAVYDWFPGGDTVERKVVKE
jgi:hypothetical protein